MYRYTLPLLAAITTALTSTASFAARPLGSHQAEPIVASPVSSGSPAGVPFIRNGSGPGISPGVGLSAPTAFGADWGDVFFGAGGNYDSNDGNGSLDGSSYLGMGFGDAERWAGLEATANLISVSDSVSEAYSFSFKLHRLLGERTAVAVGTEHQGRGGSAFPDESYEYLAVSHIFALNEANPDKLMAVPVTVGVGDGRFSKLSPSGRRYFERAQPFVAAGLIPHPRVSILAEWVGRQYNAGVSYVPFKKLPLVVTAGLLDLTEEYDDSIDFGMAVGYTLRFGK